MRIEHLAHFTIADFSYYEGALVFSNLKVGTSVTLQLEVDNKFDARVVAICYKKSKLGYVPRGENRIIYKLLTLGMEKHLRATIQKVDAREHPESQIMVVVHLINKD